MLHHARGTYSRPLTSAAARSVARRRFLRTAGALGLGGTLGTGLTGGDRVGDPETEIVYAMARGQPADRRLQPRTKTVPLQWHESLELAFDVLAELRQVDLPSVVGSYAIPGSYDDPTAGIAIDAIDEAVREPIRELSSGLPVDFAFIEAPPPQPSSAPGAPHEVPDPGWTELPSGYACRGTEASGTLAPALSDERDGTRAFATSNHLFGDAGGKTTEHGGRPLSVPHPTGEQTVGRVVRGYPRADVVRVAPVDGYRPATAIARTSPGTVLGQFTKAGLADLMAREATLQKVGAFSDRTTGEIKGIDGQTCYVGGICKRGQLKWGDEETMIDGDSGSVSFHPDPERPDESVLVCGINNARTWWPGMDFTWGTAAHHLHSEYGLHF